MYVYELWFDRDTLKVSSTHYSAPVSRMKKKMSYVMSKNSSLHLQDILLREKGTQGWSQTPSTGFGGRCQQAVLRVWVGVCVCVCVHVCIKPQYIIIIIIITITHQGNRCFAEPKIFSICRIVHQAYIFTALVERYVASTVLLLY